MGGNQELKDKRIYLSKQHYVTISVLAAIFLWLISTTYFLINYFQVAPRDEAIRKIGKNLEEVRSEKDSLSNQLARTTEDYKKILSGHDTPVILQPSVDATVIGQHVTFKWDYKHHSQYQKYFLEIRCISDPSKKDLKVNVVKSEQKLVIIPKSYLTSGEYLWRVLPGYISEKKEVIQGRPSPFGLVKIYDSALDRLKQTKVLRVGTSPSFTGCFGYMEKEGETVGFDIDLIRWITQKMGSNAGIEGFDIKIVNLPWSELLPSLANHELDVVISAMTSTSPREEKYKGVKFTEGYFKSHQIFIGLKKDGKIPQALAKKKVGVLSGTTNEQAAHFLSKRFGFKIDNSFSSYQELYTSLENMKIDLALVDDVLAKGQLGKRFHQVGPELDEYLLPFYQSKLGRPSEMYAIAVMDEPMIESKLLTSIDDILKSPEGQKKLQELNAKWIK